MPSRVDWPLLLRPAEPGTVPTYGGGGLSETLLRCRTADLSSGARVMREFVVSSRLTRHRIHWDAFGPGMAGEPKPRWVSAQRWHDCRLEATGPAVSDDLLCSNSLSRTASSRDGCRFESAQSAQSTPAPTPLASDNAAGGGTPGRTVTPHTLVVLAQRDVQAGRLVCSGQVCRLPHGQGRLRWRLLRVLAPAAPPRGLEEVYGRVCGFEPGQSARASHSGLSSREGPRAKSRRRAGTAAAQTALPGCCADCARLWARTSFSQDSSSAIVVQLS